MSVRCWRGLLICLWNVARKVSEDLSRRRQSRTGRALSKNNVIEDRILLLGVTPLVKKGRAGCAGKYVMCFVVIAVQAACLGAYLRTFYSSKRGEAFVKGTKNKGHLYFLAESRGRIFCQRQSALHVEF